MLQNGEIKINNIFINKETTNSEFKLNFASETKSYLDLLYDFVKPIKFGELSFWVEIAFEDEKIKRIEMKNADPELTTSFEEWSNKKVELKKESHDKWLVENFGEPHDKTPSGLTYKFAFGEVISYYDPQNREAGIIFEYGKQEEEKVEMIEEGQESQESQEQV